MKLAGVGPSVEPSRSCLRGRTPTRTFWGSLAGLSSPMTNERKTRNQLIAEIEHLRRELERRDRELFEEAPSLICVHDLEGTLIAVNPAAARALGYKPGEGAGRNLAEYLSPDVRDEFPEYLVRMKHFRYDEGVMKVISQDGAPRFWAYRNVLREEPGREPYVVGHALDMTDLKRAERAVRRFEARYRALVERGALGIYQASVGGRFISANPVLVAMLGYDTEEDLLALDMTRDVCADPQEHSRLISELQESDRIDGLDVAWKRRDGTEITVRLSGRVVRARDGEIECFEMIAEDVTERRALDEHVRQVQKMEAIGQLTGGIAHDFNNILTIILANADLIGASLPPDAHELRADLRELQAAARRGTATVKMLLGFGRRGMLTLRHVDVHETVTKLSAALRRLLPETIEIQLSGESSIPSVRADPNALEQIIVNLATNARDAMPDGGVLSITTRRVRLDEDHRLRFGWGRRGEYVCVTVSDTGTGMDRETRERIFEPFFTTKAPDRGTGLGMAMIYGLVKQQRGYVDVESEPGKGTTVRVLLPAAARAEGTGPETAAGEPSALGRPG